jgi:hypothetical protein
MKKHWFFFFILLFVIMSFTDSLMGIPAFARKYKMSCSVCHAPFPRLKDYGEEFAANGFVLKDKDAPRYFRDTGDETLSLIKELPIAIRLEGHIYYNNANSKKFDFASPYILKILSGGTIAKNISYYFYFFLSEQGEVAGLEDAFVMFTNIFGTGVAIAIGQFQVSDPLFKRELRLTFEDFLIYKSKPGLSNIDLTYDRGIMLTYGLKGGTDFTLEILNGSGIGEADIFKNFDSDKYKNVFGRLSQDIGDFLRIGGCVYYGKEAQGEMVNRALILGADATLKFENIEFNVQYIERKDNNPMFGAATDIELKTRGGISEVIFTPHGDKGKWYAVGLFNWVQSDMDELDYQSVSAHLGFLLRRNLRLVGEVCHIFKSSFGKHTRAGVGLITAF